MQPGRFSAPAGLRARSRLCHHQRRRHALSFGLVILAGLHHSALLAEPTAAYSDELRIVRAIDETAVHGGATIIVEVQADTGDFLVADLDQSSTEVIITFRDTDGAVLVTADPPSGRSGRNVAAHEAGAAGTYLVEILSAERRDYEGRLTGFVGLLGRGPEDSLRRAVLSMTRAAAFNHVAENSSDAAAIEKARHAAVSTYLRAAEEWARQDEPGREGLCRYYAATLIYDLYDWNSAANLARAAVEEIARSGDRLLLADAKRRLAEALIEQGDIESLDQADRLLGTALDEYTRQGDLHRVAGVENALGMTRYYRDAWPEAKDWFQRAAQTYTQAGEEALAVRAYTNSAKSDEKLGRLAEAARSHAKALELANREGDPLDRASVLDNYADTMALLGNVQDALGLYREAADEFERLGDPVGKAKAIAGIGFVLYRLGEWESARNHAREALRLQQGAFERRPLFETYQYLGNAHRGLGEIEAALEAHAQASEVAASELETALARLELGNDLLAAERHGEAELQFRAAREIADRLDSGMLQAYAAAGIGRSLLPSSTGEALALLKTALAGHVASGNLSGQAEALQVMARGYQALGDDRLALEFAGRAMDAIERLRRRVENPRLVASFSGLSRPTYDLHIELLMQLSETSTGPDAEAYVEAALAVSERARAQSLLRYMQAGLHRYVGDGQDAARGRYQRLTDELVRLRYQRERIAAPGVESDPDQVAELESRIDAIVTELTILDGAARARGPAAGARSPTVAGLRALLKTEAESRPATILEYALGPGASFLWVVNADGITAHRLPSEEQLNTLARAVHDEYSSPAAGGSRRPGGGAAQRRLAEILLGPVMDRLAGSRLVIVPDGALYFVPFAALPVPDGDDRHSPLVGLADVSYVPSLTILHQQRGDERSEARSLMAIFANPVFGASDPRLAAGFADAASEVRDPRETRTGSSPALPTVLAPLPWSAVEAEAVRRVAGPHGEVFMATSFDASVDAVLQHPLGNYRILHFATHGWADSDHPELSALTFSRIDRDGRRRPSELQLPDIYRLPLDAELVVLSACDTALGRHIPGEGVLGLTHGFMSAGSRRVLATLWQVNDRATARLMERFYEALLVDGHPPDRALAMAQRSILAERRWQDPFYWAGVTLQGDWAWDRR